MVTKTFVEFYFPGSVCSETSTRETSTRDPMKIEVPKGCFAFRFFDQDSEEVEVFGKKKTILDDMKNISPTYYLEGKVIDRSEAKCRGMTVLLANMRCNRWKHCILTPQGQAFPVEEKDVILKR